MTWLNEWDLQESLLNLNSLNLTRALCVHESISTICVCERMRLVSSAQVEAVPALYTESVVERRRDWLLLREVVERRRLRAPLQLFGMLNAQRLW